MYATCQDWEAVQETDTPAISIGKDVFS